MAEVIQSDRRAYSALFLKEQGDPLSLSDRATAAEIEMGVHDDWDGVQAFAAHREKHEKDVAGGLWYRRWFALNAKINATEKS